MGGHHSDPLYTIIIIVFVLTATHATIPLALRGQAREEQVSETS